MVHCTCKTINKIKDLIQPQPNSNKLVIVKYVPSVRLPFDPPCHLAIHDLDGLPFFHSEFPFPLYLHNTNMLNKKLTYCTCSLTMKIFKSYLINSNFGWMGGLIPSFLLQSSLSLKIEGRGSGPAVPHWIRAYKCSQRVWKENGILSFINLFFFVFCFLRTYISYKQCIENIKKITTNVCNYIMPFCDII